MSDYGRILRPNCVVIKVCFCQNRRNEREKQFLIFCGVLQQYVRTVFCHGLICLISSNSIIHLLEGNLYKGPGIRDHSGKKIGMYIKITVNICLFASVQQKSAQKCVAIACKNAGIILCRLSYGEQLISSTYLKQ